MRTATVVVVRVSPVAHRSAILSKLNPAVAIFAWKRGAERWFGMSEVDDYVPHAPAGAQARGHPLLVVQLVHRWRSGLSWLAVFIAVSFPHGHGSGLEQEGPFDDDEVYCHQRVTAPHQLQAEGSNSATACWSLWSSCFLRWWLLPARAGRSRRGCGPVS